MPPSSSQRERDSPARRQRRRRTHHRIDSNGEVLVRTRDERYYGPGPDPPSPSKTRTRRHQQERRTSRDPESEYSRTTASAALFAGQLEQLDRLNRKLGYDEDDDIYARKTRVVVERTRGGYVEDEEEVERERRRQEQRERRRRKREAERAAEYGGEEVEYEYARPRRRSGGRVISGQRLERNTYYSEKEEYRDDVRRRDGNSSDFEYEEEQRKRKRRRTIWIIIGVLLLIIVVAVVVGVELSKKKSGTGSGGASTTNSTAPSNSNLDGISESSIPSQYQGTYLDPFTWYDTTDFNVTFTSVMVGNLSIMGLNSTWDDSTQANANVPPLNQSFGYGTTPIRGINLGGWLSIEPIITPSLFSDYTTHDDVVDEWTLSDTLGPTNAKSTIEKHYSSFVNEQTFADMQAAGFDHVRILYSYWAITTYDGDPYVPLVSWRYLLRAIEWARKYGLRINLDLHGAPGSQNGWNHSGHQGVIGWLNGTDGDLNAQRTIDIHKQVSTFFAQDRYKNIVTMYGLVNEPRMVELSTSDVISWSESAITAIRANNFTGIIIFGDGFLGLDNWQGKLQGIDNLLLDVHQYVVFNTQQIVLNHHDKINFACAGWTAQAEASEDTSTGFGPTLCGEWSQADTDCATYLNNVGVGSRWEGTLNMVDTPGGSTNGSVLTPTCPTQNSPVCSCSDANADPSDYSQEYKDWLLMFAQAQMHSFEQGWGWFYWTWQTETATQWSYKAGLAAGIMPSLAYQRDFNCSQTIPDFSSLGLSEAY